MTILSCMGPGNITLDSCMGPGNMSLDSCMGLDMSLHLSPGGV